MNIGNRMNKQIHLILGLRIKDKQLQHWNKNIHSNAWIPIHSSVRNSVYNSVRNSINIILWTLVNQ